MLPPNVKGNVALVVKTPCGTGIICTDYIIQDPMEREAQRKRIARLAGEIIREHIYPAILARENAGKEAGKNGQANG
nr:MAG TPA: hypothetical protein [Caudoviricetes sp.]